MSAGRIHETFREATTKFEAAGKDAQRVYEMVKEMIRNFDIRRESPSLRAPMPDTTLSNVSVALMNRILHLLIKINNNDCHGHINLKLYCINHVLPSFYLHYLTCTSVLTI
jgi:hypothetical protein